ncbi:SRPBCC family protein [Edaphobacter bradus]|uniref:SRPBCC family protein n=1 Tax=Edaphobacter bradus TaxID=2259016 RepID=UPI0021DF45EE|nr:hypothetical protein [Edaphobacter bradus]
MKTIQLSIWVDAPVERCYRLATSAGFHADLTGTQREAGTGGLKPGDKLRWPGRLLRIELNYVTRIEVLRPFAYFLEVLESGVFGRLEHEHHFTAVDDGTRVRDLVRFEARPELRRAVMAPLLARYLLSQLKDRNLILKQVAESDAWKRYLEPLAEKAPIPEAAPRAEVPEAPKAPEAPPVWPASTSHSTKGRKMAARRA